MERRSSSDWSNLGSDYDEARKRANQAIINVRQFFPTIDGGIRIYKDKMSYLGHNSEDESTRRFLSRTTSTKSKSSSQLPDTQEEGADAEAADSVFPTELELEEAARKARRDDWVASRRRKILKMAEVVEGAVAEQYKRAMLAMKSGDFDCALRRLRKCRVMRPDEPDFFKHTAEICVRICDFASAIANYRHCLRLQPGNQDYWDRLAYLYLLHGQTLFDQAFYPEALEAFAKAAEMRPESEAYETRSIACLTALGRNSECLALVNRRIESGAANADLHVMRARLQLIFKNFTLAFYDARDALAIDPEHRPAAELRDFLLNSAGDLGRQAIELALGGRLREALKKVSLAIQMDPSVAKFHVRRAALHRRLGDFNSAVEDCLMALDKCDHDVDTQVYADSQRQLLLTFNDFAVECYLKGFFEEAISLLDKAIRAEKSDPALFVNRGDCFYQVGQLVFALRDYEQAEELRRSSRSRDDKEEDDGDEKKDEEEEGEENEEEDEDEETKRKKEKEKEEEEKNSDESLSLRLSLVHHRIGQEAFQDKRFADSVRHFTQAIAKNPLCHHLWTARGRSLYFLPDPEAARRDMGTALLLGAELTEATRTLLSRLFPGVPADQVLRETPGLRRTAQQQLAKVWRPKVRQQQPQQQQRQGDGQAVVKTSRRGVSERRRTDGIPNAAEFARERRQHRRLLRQKAAVGRGVAMALKGHN